MSDRQILIPPPAPRPTGGTAADLEHWYQGLLAGAFAVLRQRWKDAQEGRTFAALAREMGVTPSRVNDWARWLPGVSATPLWSIQWLCGRLGLALLVAPDGARLIPYRPRRAPAPNPADAG